MQICKGLNNLAADIATKQSPSVTLNYDYKEVIGLEMHWCVKSKERKGRISNKTMMQTEVLNLKWN